MTRDEAGKLVGMAVAAFPTMQDKVIGPTINTWAMVMADINYQMAEMALVKVLSEKAFFPAPADIIKAVKSMKKSDGPPPVELAWQEVQSQLNSYQKPEYTHAAITETVRSLGYKNLCHSENLVADRAHFFKIYEIISERKKNESDNERVFRLVYKQDPSGRDENGQPQSVGDIMKKLTDEGAAKK